MECEINKEGIFNDGIRFAKLQSFYKFPMQVGTKCISLTFLHVTLCVLILIESAKFIESESYYRWKTKRQKKKKKEKKEKKRGTYLM